MTRSISKEEIDEVKNVFTFNTDEDITIIWFDDSIDMEIKTILEQLHDHIQMCHSFDDMTLTIDNIRNEKIILIVAGRYSRETLLRIHNNEKIDTIYIFCLNISLYQDLLEENKYSKLVGIYTDYTSLFTILKQQIHLILKHLSIFNLIHRTDKPIRDLQYESSNYLWYQLFRDTLMTMQTETEQCKQQLIDYCRSYYRLNKTYLAEIDLFNKTYTSSNAIYWYTKDSFIYRFVNKALRTEDIQALFRLRYFIKDLCTNLKLLFDKNFQDYQDSLDVIKVYRGLTLPITVIDQLKQSIGKYVSTNGFLSTSLKLDVAEMFHANVIFEIEVDTNLKNIIYGYIAQMSANKSEEEVLFDLGAIFQIENVQYKHDKYIIKMVGIDNNIEYLKSDFFQIEREYLQDNLIDNILSNINAYSFFGKFLSTMGSSKMAIEYFEELYNNSYNISENKLLNEYETYIITGNLSVAYAQNGQYEYALKYALISYDIHKNFYGNYSVPIAVSLLRISLIYLTNKDIQLAFDYIQEAFKNLPTNPTAQLLGPIHLCMSICYLKQGNYSEALQHCQISLEKFTETKNSVALSETHYKLGKIYQHLSNQDMTIKNYELSLTYQKNIYSNSHPSRIKTCYNLAKIYHQSEQYDLSIYYYLEVINNKDHNEQTDDIYMLHDSIVCCYLELEQYDLAMKHIHLSLSYIEKSMDIERIEISYMLLGNILERQQKYDLAVQCYENLVKKSIECNNNQIMKKARTKYISNMTCLIIKQDETEFESNIKILSDFLDSYLFHENYFILDDVKSTILSIECVYTRMKKFSLAIQQFERMITQVDRILNTCDDKLQIILFLNTRIAWLYQKDEQFHSAIDKYQRILLKIKEIECHILKDDVISTALDCYAYIGQLYYDLNEYHAAIESQLEGLKLTETLNSNQYEQEIFDFHYTIANCYVELENIESARVHYMKCVELEKKSSISVKESGESIYMYGEIGNLYYKNKQYDLAIDCYKKGLNILQSADDEEFDDDIFEFNYKIGCCYQLENNMDLCIEHFRTALSIQESSGQLHDEKEYTIDMNFRLGWFYQQQKDYDLAIEYFEKNLNIQQIDNDDNNMSDIFDSYVRIGTCYQQKEMINVCLDFYEKALELFTVIKKPDSFERKKIADLHWRIGKIYQHKQEWNTCIELYEISLKFLSMNNVKVVFDIYCQLGFCYEQISNGESKTIDYYKKSIEINPYDELRTISFYYHIGVCYQKIGEPSNAIEYFQIYKNWLDEQEEKDVVQLADLYAQIGFCFCEIEDWSSSLDYCLISFGIYRSVETFIVDRIYRLCITVGHCYGKKEMYESALIYFEQALQILDDENNHINDKKYELIHMNNQMGFCYFMLDQYDMAYDYCDRSIRKAQNSSYSVNHFSMIDNYEILGHVYANYHEIVLANNCFKKAIHLAKLIQPINLVQLERIQISLKRLKYGNFMTMINMYSL